MEARKERSLERFFYALIIICFVSMAIVFLVLSQVLDVDLLLKFSMDKSLAPSTQDRLNSLVLVFFSLSILSLLVTLLLFYLKKKTLAFLKVHDSLIKNIFVLFVTLFIFFMCFEMILRVALKNETSLYGFGPASVEFSHKYVYINSEGFRDYDFNVSKNPGTFRIAVLGDSFTYGWGINNVNDTYPKVLEMKLNSIGTKRYEVLNLGIPGYNTPEELDTLKKKVAAYNPDLIILGYVLNDFIDADKNVTVKYLQLPYVGFWLRNVLYSYYFIETRANKLIENLGYKQNYEDSLVTRYSSEKDIAYNSGLFREFSDETRKKNLSTVIVLFPMIYNFEDYPFEKANEFVRNISDTYGFEMVDLLDAYKAYPENELVINKYDSHPNELAQRIAADQIYASLVSNRLIYP